MQKSDEFIATCMPYTMSTDGMRLCTISKRHFALVAICGGLCGLEHMPEGIGCETELKLSDQTNKFKSWDYVK